MSRLPGNLARYRKLRGLSQERLAEAASLGVDTVARIEQGTRTTTRPATLRQPAAALDITVDQLLGTLPTAGYQPVDVAPLRRAITASADIPGLAEFAEPNETVGVDGLVQTAHRLGAPMSTGGTQSYCACCPDFGRHVYRGGDLRSAGRGATADRQRGQGR